MVRPALESGTIILADRAIDTYCVYQLISLKEAFPDTSDDDLLLWLLEIDRLGGIVPDITFYLYLDFVEAIRRAEERDGKQFTSEERAFARKAFDIYEKLLKRDPQRIKKIDVTSRTIDQVCDLLVETIRKVIEEQK